LDAAFGLAAITAILHFYIGVVIVGLPTGIFLILIGLVYLGGIGLIAARYRQDLLLKVGIVWVVVVIVLWAGAAAENAVGTRDPLAYADKIIEVVLLAVLLRLRMARTK